MGVNGRTWLIALVVVAFAAMNNAAWAQCQPELNERAMKECDVADAQMNKIYKQLLSKNKGDKVFVQKLEKAQKAWLVFRDAEMAASFPLEGNPRENYGSSYQMEYAQEMTALTKDRTKQLKEYLGN